MKTKGYRTDEYKAIDYVTKKLEELQKVFSEGVRFGFTKKKMNDVENKWYDVKIAMCDYFEAMNED